MGGGERSYRTFVVREEDAAHPAIANFPSFMPNSLLWSRSPQNFIFWSLVLSEKAVFIPVSKLSAKASKSDLLQNLEPFSFSKRVK